MSSATYRELLGSNRHFRRLWAGQLISELGTWFSFIAELGLVRMLSGSPLATTALLVSRLLPFLLAAPFAGVLVDRVSRKRVMIAADLLRALVALGYLTVAPMHAIWIACVCGALTSSLSVFFEGAKNAAMPNMVSWRELLTANVMMYSTRFLQFTIGSALGGITAASLGYNAAFLVNSLSFVASALFIALIPETAMRADFSRSAPEPTLLAAAEEAGEPGDMPIAGIEQPVEQPSRHLISDLREGLAYIWSTPFVRGIILVNIGWATGGGMVNILYDRMGGHVFASEGDNGDWSVAILYTAAGAGLFVGMMLARRAGAWASDERRAGRYIGWSLISHGATFAMTGFMASIGPMALLIGISRLIIGMEFGVQETLMMKVLPDEYRGRVFTTDRALELGTMTLSMVAAGWLLTSMSPRAVMVLSGVLSAIPGIIWLLAVSLTRFGVPARAVRESYGD